MTGLPGGAGGPPANAGDVGWFMGGEDPLEEEMATHSSNLTWEIPWTEEPSPGSHKELNTTEHST